MKIKFSIFLFLPFAFAMQASAQIKQSTILKQGIQNAAIINKIVSIVITLDSTTTSGTNRIVHAKATINSIGPGPVQYQWVVTTMNQPPFVWKGNYTPSVTGSEVLFFDKTINTNFNWNLLLQTNTPTFETSNYIKL